jgi:hypothetical protein
MALPHSERRGVGSRAQHDAEEWAELLGTAPSTSHAAATADAPVLPPTRYRAPSWGYDAAEEGPSTAELAADVRDLRGELRETQALVVSLLYNRVVLQPDDQARRQQRLRQAQQQPIGAADDAGGQAAPAMSAPELHEHMMVHLAERRAAGRQ